MVELHRRDVLEEVAPQRLQLDQPLGVSRARTAYSLRYSLRYSLKYSRGTHLQLEQPLGVGHELVFHQRPRRVRVPRAVARDERAYSGAAAAQ